MKTLWAIEVTPLNGRGKPWIDHFTIRALKRDAWAVKFENASPEWWDEMHRRKQAGLLRAVKVTINTFGT